LVKSLSPKVSRQRLQLKFTRGPEVRYISHLDLMRLWERALRRAGIPIAYSEGFNPRPRMALGSPLAVGVTSDGELLDLFLEQRISPYHLTTSISKELPDGISILEVAEMGLKVPSLQSRANQADYIVTITSDKTPEQIQSAVDSFLDAKHIEWQHKRDKKIREYDIRALVQYLQVIGGKNNEFQIGMRLKISGRPEQVCAALGFSDHPSLIHRTGIILDEIGGN
jgi:radical SAM-linked protein